MSGMCVWAQNEQVLKKNEKLVKIKCLNQAFGASCVLRLRTARRVRCRQTQLSKARIPSRVALRRRGASRVVSSGSGLVRLLQIGGHSWEVFVEREEVFQQFEMSQWQSICDTVWMPHDSLTVSSIWNKQLKPKLFEQETRKHKPSVSSTCGFLDRVWPFCLGGCLSECGIWRIWC